MQAFSQMGTQASYGRPLIEENHLFFISCLMNFSFDGVFWTVTFQILAKSLEVWILSGITHCDILFYLLHSFRPLLL